MENIFCLARTDLENIFGSPLPQGSLAEPGLSAALALPHYFIPRPEAENDPSFKQIIPYQLFCCDNRYFVFQRGARVGEQRLSGRLSLGIGGHINDRDADNGHTLSGSDFNNALARERHEELLSPRNLPILFRGWINDDSDDVGRVHLGAVYLCQVESEAEITIRPDGEDLRAIGWLSAAEIRERRVEFEKWSSLALELINL